MALAKDYQSVMGRSNEIQKEALGLDYSDFETSPISFDYDALIPWTKSKEFKDCMVSATHRFWNSETSQN